MSGPPPAAANRDNVTSDTIRDVLMTQAGIPHRIRGSAGRQPEIILTARRPALAAIGTQLTVPQVDAFGLVEELHLDAG